MIFILTPAAIIIFVIHPVSLASGAFLAANLFPEKFHEEVSSALFCISLLIGVLAAG